MFEGGVPDQFHQFIASRTSLTLPLSFSPLHGSSNIITTTTTTTATTNLFPTFDPYGTTSHHHHQQVPLQPNFLHPLHQSSSPPPTSKNEDKEEGNMVAMGLETERERSIHEPIDSWSGDEVLALLRIRSSMENWFPEFTWEHVSRKLEEVGFKRSAEKCKEKFEEESRYFNNINYSKNNNYRVFSELEELCHAQEIGAEKNKKMEQDQDKMDQQNLEEHSRIGQRVANPTTTEDNGKDQIEKSKSKKRKRQKKFEMFKRFCQDVISKIMAQQEEMHNKLLEDMVKRDEEKVAREEAWKKQEMNRINKELELRAQEQALAGDRQATIINFLKKFSSSSSMSTTTTTTNPSSASSSSLVLSQNPNPTSKTSSHSKPEAPISTTTAALGQENSTSLPVIHTSLKEYQARHQNPSSTPPLPNSSTTLSPAPQNPNLLNSQSNPSVPSSDIVMQKKSMSNDKEDLGKRWPKDEVLALINLRCSLYNSNEEKEATIKAPLWERISQGMMELGYKRSAKRCKEKWENINKYFRKTKDVNKKRPVDSRTCPYFHQLSTLYNQGTVAAPPSEGSQEKSSAMASPGNDSTTRLIISSQNGSNNSTTNNVVSQGEKNLVQAPGLDFEF